jgi:hypothetical protein
MKKGSFTNTAIPISAAMQIQILFWRGTYRKVGDERTVKNTSRTPSLPRNGRG